MSAQRYPASDQRYAPPDDSRFPPRDRSPPRYAGDRFSSSSTYRPGYQNRSDEPRDSAGSSVNRDAPRGPKAAFDSPRGNVPFSPAAPRGRGFSGRGDYRSVSRASDTPRDSRDPPSWTDDRERSWADRDLDRRERRPSSPGRPRPSDFRDFREPAPPPRDYDFNRSRIGTRDPPPVGGPPYESRREPFPSRGRGYLTRGRGGRGDWDGRSRDRDAFADERSVRSRSRSPLRDFRSDRETGRTREAFDARDDRRFDARDDRPPLDKAERDRNFERFNRERSPFRNDSRRPSVSSTDPSSPRPLSPALTQQSGTGRTLNESSRPMSALRRVSTNNLSAERWEDRRENTSTEPQDTRERQDSRPSSPPPPIQVPAFGGWNVWRAAPTEPKAMKQNTSSSGAAPPTTVTPAAPTGTKLAPPPANAKPSSERLPPTGPKVDPINPMPRASANVHPQRLNRMQSQPGVTSPPASPEFVAPPGPRAIPASGSPPNLGTNIPTGPKVDRVHPQAPSWAPSAPATGAVRQWPRRNSFGQAGRSGLVTPAKRDFSGEERMRESLDNAVQTNPDQNGLQSTEDTDVTQRPSSSQYFGNKGRRSPTWGEELETSAVGAGPIDSNNRLEHDQGDDMMELDEDDFEKKELRFQREKARLESELVDLSSSELRGSHALEQLALLSCISLSTLPPRENPPTGHLSNEQAIFGTGQLLTPKAEGLSQNGIAVRKHFIDTEPAPIGSPELQALPFLHKGPPTPLEDLDVYKQNAIRYNQMGPNLEMVLKERFAAKQNEERVREDIYGDWYRPWMSLVEQVDKEPKEETPPEEEPAPSPSAQATDPSALPTSASEGRRRGGVSEYDIERVLQESLETANRENQRRMKLESSAKMDHDKEAIENAQKDSDIRDEHDFIDKNRQITVSQAVTRWNFEPPVDNVSREDHELLVKHFRDYPKKWGKIAQSIANDGGGLLTYKDCINHYYATKWSQEYKERRDKRRQRAQKGGRLRGAQGRPKANALISNLGDVRAELYDGDDFGAANVAVTDSGRPRRAAAPTFGEKEAEEQLQPTAAPIRRGLKGNDSLNGAPERASRKTRGSTKERGGKKSRGQSSMRPRSMSPEKMDVEHARRSLMDARLSNGTPSGDFDVGNSLNGVGSGITGNASGGARGVGTEASHASQGTGASIEGATTSTSQQPRSGPSSYWSVQEVSAFPAYLAHYGTDWHGIAQKMDTKTGTMVKNYYFRLISNNNRPDLEELVRKADQKRSRGEQVGPIDPPALPPKKRGEGSQPSAPRTLAPSAETTDAMNRSPPYRATASAQQMLPDSRGRQNYSPAPQRPSVHSISGQTMDIGQNGSEQNPLQARRHDQSSRQPHVPQHQGTVSQSSRSMLDYDAQSRQGLPQSLQQGRNFSDVSLPPSQQSLPASSSRYYQSSPQKQVAQLAMNAGGHHRTSHSDFKGVDDGRYSHPMDPPVHRPSYGGQPSMHRHSPGQRYTELRRSRPSSPVPEQNRYPSSSSQAPSQGAPASRTEPRKTSNLLALLNTNDEPPRRSNNQPSRIETATPPPSQYPPRPSSHPDRGMQYSEPERSATYPKPSFPHQSSAPSRAHTDLSSRESQSSSSSMGRQDWQGQPTFAPLIGSTQQAYRPHLLDRAPAPSASMEYHRSSLQSLNPRHGPSPPPSLGFSHPPHVPQSHQQSHQRPSSPPRHSVQPNSYSQNLGQSSSAIQQNHQSFQRNNSLGMQSHQQGLSQRQSAYEGLSSRTETDYRSRHDSIPRAKDEEVQISRERASQTRSNLRPDSFLTRDYRNPFKQPAQQRQNDHEQSRQYGPVQDEQIRPLSPRLSQTYSGRAQEQQPPPSSRG